MKYRARGRYEARQWDGTRDPAWETWLGEWFDGWDDDPPQLRFHRADGERYAAIAGQWIVQYHAGDFAALPADIFERHYEPCGE